MSAELVRYKETADSFVTLEGDKKDLTPQEIRASIAEIEKKMLGFPNEEKIAIATTHTFAEGLYTRSVLMKAGSMVCGKIHKLEHIVVIGQGSASVVSEEFGSKFIHAPMVFQSRPYVKRLLFIHSDMIWTTVHKNPTNTRDLKELEEFLMAPYFQGANQ